MDNCFYVGLVYVGLVTLPQWELVFVSIID